MQRIIIAAVAENGVIGAEDGIPWHYPEDFKHFKATTSGHPVIMGRRTYEGIASGLGGPLPDRLNIVLSFEELDLPDGAVNVHSIDEALEAAADTGDEQVYIAGGGTIYEQFLDQGLVDRMVLTAIPEEPEGDTYFPEWDKDDWELDGTYEVGDGLAVNEWVSTQ